MSANVGGAMGTKRKAQTRPALSPTQYNKG